MAQRDREEEGRRKLSCPKRESSSACVASRANVNLVVMLAQPTLAEPCMGTEEGGMEEDEIGYENRYRTENLDRDR